MKISKIKLNNFRIYQGENQIQLDAVEDKNINIIAGKNGFGKTTFLTSLIWCFYGNLMVQVEDKYKKDIKNAGGYDNYLLSLMNRDVLQTGKADSFEVEVQLKDLLIPSIPCRTVNIKRSFDLRTNKEDLRILIDGDENELTKEVGFEVFINDFILPREIAKFFFFDAEKIVALAEAKSKAELRSLSRAYSEVLGIKKYEELKNHLESLLVKLKRRGVTELEQAKLDELIRCEEEFEKRISHNEDKKLDIERQILNLQATNDSLQEKLIREGNSITLEELKELKLKRDKLKDESQRIKSTLKKLLDLVPFVIAGRKFVALHQHVRKEGENVSGVLNNQLLIRELENFSKAVLEELNDEELEAETKARISKLLENQIASRADKVSFKKVKVQLEYSEEKAREFEAIYTHINTSFLNQFKIIVNDEKINRALLSRTISKIKQAEARKDNHLVQQFREEKAETTRQIEERLNSKNSLVEELGALRHKYTSSRKVRSEYEKNFKLIKTDRKKYEVTLNLLIKINDLIKKIKQEKKYSLQKAISLGLGKLMHKRDFIGDVRVNIIDDVMDIDLLDIRGNVIDKDSLSKGEQQLYATALLKALVDESGIEFPIFIDSPLQKFDKFHSKNIIKQFYPSISKQVVLFPLLEKELSEEEYSHLKPHLNKAFLIENSGSGSNINSIPVEKLFEEFKKDRYVHAH